MTDGFNFDDEDDVGGSTSVADYPPEPIQRTPKRPQKRRSPPRRTAAPSEAKVPAFFPMQPKNISETGLSVSYLEELYLKHLFQAGELRGSEITGHMGLPGGIVDELTQRLRKPRFIDVKGSSGAGVSGSGGGELLRAFRQTRNLVTPLPSQCLDFLHSLHGHGSEVIDEPAQGI